MGKDLQRQGIRGGRQCGERGRKLTFGSRVKMPFQAPAFHIGAPSSSSTLFPSFQVAPWETVGDSSLVGSLSPKSEIQTEFWAPG